MYIFVVKNTRLFVLGLAPSCSRKDSKNTMSGPLYFQGGWFLEKEWSAVFYAECTKVKPDPADARPQRCTRLEELVDKFAALQA